MGNRLGTESTITLDVLWRGTTRRVDVVFGNVRDPAEVPDVMLRSSGDVPKLVVDFPLDDKGRSPEDDLDRLDRWVENHEPTRTVCWLPSFLNTAGLRALQVYVAIDELLRTQSRYEQHTPGLSQTQRLEARPILESRRNQLGAQLREALLSAYGATAPGHELIDPAQSLTDHFRSLDPALTVRPTTQPSLAGAFDELVDQIHAALYPGHPPFEERVTRPQLQTTWVEVSRAIDSDDGRVLVETSRRSAVRTVANALGLGTMHESAFVLSDDWLHRLDRHLDSARSAGRSVTVADVRAWIDDAPGGPRGLPPDIADLVVYYLAARTDHALTNAGRAVPVEPGRPLAPEVTLRPEQLPELDQWQLAVARAAALFGLTFSPRPSAAEMATLAERVQKAAAALGRAPADLVRALDDAAGKLGIDDRGDRMRSARAGADLVAALAPSGLAAITVVQRLIDAAIPTSAEAVAKSLSSAPALLHSLGETNWNLLQLAGSDVLEPMRQALRTDEFALGDNGFEATRKTMETKATAIVGGRTGAPAPTPPPTPTQSSVGASPLNSPPPPPGPQVVTARVTSRAALDQLLDAQLNQVLASGAEVTITWPAAEGQ